ncbi:hypothetical protein SRHO_G00074580 [Serrasalmus rhombeus]
MYFSVEASGQALSVKLDKQCQDCGAPEQVQPSPAVELNLLSAAFLQGITGPVASETVRHLQQEEEEEFGFHGVLGDGLISSGR